jgi:hypothetical protein
MPSPVSKSSRATLQFSRDWSEVVTGNLKAGGTVELNYAPERLTNRLGGVVAIQAFVAFDSQWQQPVDVFSSDEGKQKPVVAVPEGTNEVECYFRAFTRHPNMGSPGINFDSDFGRNYRFDITW